MRQILIVANQTVGSDALAGSVRACMAAGPCRFVLLVPATVPNDFDSVIDGMSRIETGIWDPSTVDPLEAAGDRLRSGLGWLRHLGATAEGEVGDGNPMRAIRTSLKRDGRQFDEIIISTLPRRISRWLRMDLPRRVKREFGLPVTVVSARSATT
jgi:hypothetical protein